MLDITPLYAPATETDDNSGENGLILRQVEIPETSQEANLSDLSVMYAMVMRGRSARDYRKPSCPIELLGKNRVAVPLDFYVWPGDMDTKYNLSAEFGAISDQHRIELPVEFDVVMKRTDSHSLDYIFEGDITFESPCISSTGRIIDRPVVEVVGRKIILDHKAFCVLRLKGHAIGYRHTLTMEFDVVRESHITSINNAVIASWMVGTECKTEPLDIEIPKCVADFLELCPDGLQVLPSGVSVADPIATVYWSGCTGKYLGVRYDR